MCGALKKWEIQITKQQGPQTLNDEKKITKVRQSLPRRQRLHSTAVVDFSARSSLQVTGRFAVAAERSLRRTLQRLVVFFQVLLVVVPSVPVSLEKEKNGGFFFLGFHTSEFNHGLLQQHFYTYTKKKML